MTASLAKLLDAELAARGEAFNAFVTALSTQAASASDEVGKLQKFLDASPEVAKALPAVTSVAVYHKGKMHAAGAVSAADAQKVVGKVLETWKPATKEATAYRSLTDLSPELASVSGAAGVVAVPLLSDSVLLLFRPDANATVTYAGVPKVVFNRVTGTMHSRRDSSSPTAVKQSGCTAWSPTDMDAARAFSAALGGVVSGSPAAPGAGAIGVDSAATAEVAERFRRLEERVGQLVAELKEK